MATDKALSLNNGLPAIRNWIKEKFVGKVEGKGLSENDFTAALKEKLEGIEAGAIKYVHPAHTARAGGLYKVTVNATGHITNVEAVTKADITALGIPGQDTNTTYTNFKAATASVAGGSGLVPAPPAGAQTKYMCGDGTWQIPPNTTYGPATATSNGLMTKEDFAKLAAFQAAGSYALKSELGNVYKYQGSVANEASLPTTGMVPGYVYNIEAKSSYGPAGVNVAWTEAGTWDNLGGNFTIEYATAAEVLAILNA